MQIQDRYLDAATTVLDFDIPEDGYSEAVLAQAFLMAGPEAEDTWNGHAWGYGVDRRVH